MFDNKKILITGGSGSWGNEITRQLLRDYNPEQIIIYSRGEQMQVTMDRRFKSHPKLKFVIGNVQDLETLKEACRGVHYIFHLAALKHVPICEDNPWQSIKTNIIGTENVVKAAIANEVELVLDCSSDKACNPVNTYGLGKAMGEKIMIQANHRTNKTKFVCTRAGNAMGTRGSIIPFFFFFMERGKEIPITDNRMTRYFMTIEEAIGLVFKAMENCRGGEIFVMNMDACKVIDLANAMIEELDSASQLIETGIRPGEKLNESLISEHEALATIVFDETYYVILPQLNVNGIKEKYKDFKKFDRSKYTSNDVLMGTEEIKGKLRAGGFV